MKPGLDGRDVSRWVEPAAVGEITVLGHLRMCSWMDANAYRSASVSVRRFAKGALGEAMPAASSLETSPVSTPWTPWQW